MRFHPNGGIFSGAVQTVQDTQHPNTYRVMYNDMEVVLETDWFIFSINLGICLETTISILLLQLLSFFFWCGPATQRGSWPPHSWGFLNHTQRRTTVSRTPLDEWSARRRDLYLTTHNTHNRQISMPPWDSNSRSQQANGRRPWDRHC